MARQVSLSQLQEDFKQLEKQERDEPNNMEQFVILPVRTERQILQINLIPAGIVYLRGEKIYSNSSQLNITNQKQLFSFWNKILKRDNNLSMFINDTQALKILGIKHTVYSGQILIIDLAVYNFQNLIASKKAFPKQQSRHPILPELRLIQHKSKLQNIFDALDANQQTIILQAGSLLMEKYLAEEEQFYISHRNALIAVSKDVKLELVKGGSVFGVKAKGKGWLFYQTNKNQRKLSNKWRNMVFYLILLSFITPVLQLMIAYMI